MATTDEGLRERKKRETRRRIADTATMLFVTRGFDNVTVAEVAAAAEVSKMTVFNYFPRKEDLFFDRGDEAATLLTGAVRDRAPGEGVVPALHRLLVRLVEEHHPLSGLRDGAQPFWQTVIDSPALLAAAREGAEHLERTLAEAIADTVAAAPGDEQPRLVAALVMAAYRTLYVASVRRLLSGERAAAIEPDYLSQAHQAFTMLARAAPDYGAGI